MNMTEKIAGLTFGCELEYVNITQRTAAQTVAEVTGGTVRYVGRHLNNYEVEMPDGRKWEVVSDASVGRDTHRSGCETVTPVLTVADMDMLQNVVRALRRAGARADRTCGLHIHVGTQGMTARQITNIAKSWYMGENIYTEGCGTAAARLSRWTRPYSTMFVDRLLKIKKPTMEKLADAFYGPYGDRYSHYSQSRYVTLNLHNLWNGTKKTVEFRLFEATTHAGEVKANALFALSFVAKAIAKARVCAKPDKYERSGKGAAHDMKLMFHYLCWNGDDFKVARWHFLKRAKEATATH